MATVPAEVPGPSDAELIDEVRGGKISSYGTLYERHVGAAYNLARQLSRSTAESDDLVSEAFARVLDTLRAGRGPDSAFRAYLLTSLRHVAYDKTRRDRKLELAEDVTEVHGIDTEKISEQFKDTAVAGLERSMAARAFAKLPERWQAVLWHTEIEGQSPAEVAPILGLTANGVSALAYRAREGLRQAYLQVHLAETTAERCQATVEKLGAWTRGGLSKRETAQVETHLDECGRCRALAAELADVNGALRLLIAPLVLGAGTVGYLALAGKAAAATTAAVGAGAAGGAAAGAAGGKAAAGAAAGLPRQLLGVGGAAAAVAAALVIALAGATTQHIPTAAAVPPPPVIKTTPKPPPPQKPVPPPPAAPPSNKTQPPSSSKPAPPPAPGTPTLHASGPGQTITLTPGGGPIDVPISASNTGNAPSGPVSATLNLPAGVSALGPGQTAGTGAHPAANTFTLPTLQQLRLQAATGQLPQVDCPGGTGTVACSGPSSLQPGQSVVLMFRLAAAKGTQGGTITGTVTAGGSMSVQITVDVAVPPPPPPPPTNDELSLTAHEIPGWQAPPWLPPWILPFDKYPSIDIAVRNTGTSTKTISVGVDRTVTLVSRDGEAVCSGAGLGTECQSTAAIAPDKQLYLRVRLYGGHDADSVTITATLGSASRSVTLDCDGWPLPPFPEPPSPNAPPWTSPTWTPPSGTDPHQRPTTTTKQPPTTTTAPSNGHNQPGPPPVIVGPPVTTKPTTTTPAPTDPPTPTPSCTNQNGPGAGHVQPGGLLGPCGPLSWLLGPL
ncbi:MAG TPA: sigma-70 family RNA polymerase sigma factor [Pseudonocardiaceae bacterium]|nr:sigma-70 family RNA polymerase sigma factor [Pseudonocardiaceae bacterium]